MNSTASSSRERTSRRLAGLQHRGRQFQPQTRDPSAPALATSKARDAVPAEGSAAPPGIPSLPSPPSSPKALGRTSSFPNGTSTHSPPTPPTASPSSWSSSAARPPKGGGGCMAGPASPTPYFSPSRSTDDGDSGLASRALGRSHARRRFTRVNSFDKESIVKVIRPRVACLAWP